MEQAGLFPMLTPITSLAADIDLGARGDWSNYGAMVILAEDTRARRSRCSKRSSLRRRGKSI